MKYELRSDKAVEVFEADHFEIEDGVVLFYDRNDTLIAAFLGYQTVKAIDAPRSD